VININYSNLIKSYISKSGYKLDELSELLNEQGISATKEYLSRLQNGKRPPASDDLNIALAKLTGNDPNEIIISAYIEKAPENIKGLLSGYFDIFYNKNHNEQFSKIAYQVERKFPGFTKGIYSEEELVQDSVYREYKELSKTFLKKHLGENIDITSEERKKYYKLRNLNEPLKVPIMNFIKRAEPLFSEKHISDWAFIPNLWELNENKAILLKATDNSMENSRIQTNDLILVKICNEINDGDIVVMNIDDEDATIRKIKYIDKESAWVYPSNSLAFEPKLIKMNSVRIIGKVVQILVTPN
jgi:SOS-response transcriptional repressor LexA